MNLGVAVLALATVATPSTGANAQTANSEFSVHPTDKALVQFDKDVET